MIHPTFSATASATRQMPRTTKNAMVFRRLEIRMVSQVDCTAERGRLIQEMLDFKMEGRRWSREVQRRREFQLCGAGELNGNEICLRCGRWNCNVFGPLLLRNFRAANLAREAEFIHDPNSVPI